MGSEATEALGQTDRSLRRILRRLKDADLGSDEALEEEIKRARRQLRVNQQLLGNGAADADTA